MPDFGRNSRNNEPSLDAIVASDRFIDALASGRQISSPDPADGVLAELLGEWRDEMRWPPASGLITERQAVDALRAGVAEKRNGVRSRRGLSIVGAAAAGVLLLGGFGAVVAGAGPGDALYGLRSMLFGSPKQVRDDHVTLAAAKEQLAQVQELVAQGDWPAAQAKLVEVSNQVSTVGGDDTQKQAVLDQWNQLSAKVVQKDPEATVPPGITYTVPASATELVPAAITPSVVVPSNAPEVPPPNSCRSAGCEPPIVLSTGPDGTGTFLSPPPLPPTTQVEQTEPTITTTIEPTTTVEPTTSAVPTTTSAAPATTATTVLPTTTTTTVLPTTTTTTPGGGGTPSQSAAPQSPASAATSSPSPAAAESPSAASTSTAVQQQAPASVAPSSAPSVIEPTTVASIPSTVVQTAIQTPQTRAPSVMTTTMMPMPGLPQLGSSHNSGH